MIKNFLKEEEFQSAYNWLVENDKDCIFDFKNVEIKVKSFGAIRAESIQSTGKNSILFSILCEDFNRHNFEIDNNETIYCFLYVPTQEKIETRDFELFKFFIVETYSKNLLKQK